MTAVTYIARRSLVIGHTAGTEYSMNLQLLSSTPGLARRPTIEVNESLSGRREVIRYNAILRGTIFLAPMSGSVLLQLLEFLDSVEGGEEFTLDLYGSIASPVNPTIATLDEAGYTKERAVAMGFGGANDAMNVSFSVRVIQP